MYIWLQRAQIPLHTVGISMIDDDSPLAFLVVISCPCVSTTTSHERLTADLLALSSMFRHTRVVRLCQRLVLALLAVL